MNNKTTKIGIILLSLLAMVISLPMSDSFSPNIATATPVSNSFNGTMMQYYEWYLPNDGQLWNNLAADAEHLQSLGITAVWIPPAYKATQQDSNGYDVYDLWDLGEFYQKGTIRTKWGTKTELQNAITALHNNNIQVYADIVINHKFGADYQEWTEADRVDGGNRYNKLEHAWIQAWTGYNFPGRGDTYSAFKWNNTCIKATTTEDGKIWLFSGCNWEEDVDKENGNYDYLMGEDVDFSKQYVADHLIDWGSWLVNTFSIDGFRLDSVKHYSFNYQKEWLNTIRSNTGKELFTVGEYWSGDLAALENYGNMVGWDRSIFDVPLHYRFYDAANGNGNYDMRQILNGAMMKNHPIQAVTFVDNHDTEPGQSLQSWVAEWFKPQAYAFILTRLEGYPCVFYGDYYGIPTKGITAMGDKLDPILQARKEYSYGTQHDGDWDNDILCWTREGDDVHPGSGLAALISDGGSGIKNMYVGTQHAGETWSDITGNRTDQVTIDSNGKGYFPVNGRSVSIWVPGEATPPEPRYVTVYYQQGFDPAYIHYRPAGGSWTTVPGVKMDDCGYSGYKVKTIDIGSATQLEACFTDGQGNWDSNNMQNYFFAVGVWTYIQYGNITSGTPVGTDTEPPTAPCSLQSSGKTSSSISLAWNAATDNVDVTGYEIYRNSSKVGASITTNYTDSGLSSGATYTYTVKAYDAAGNKSGDSNTITVTTDSSGNRVTIYYKQGFSPAYIHYRPAGGSWTTVPGVKMDDCAYSGYKVKTIDIGSATQLEACFTDGQGNWDSNNMQNYFFAVGVWTYIQYGNIQAGTPAETGNRVTIYYKQGFSPAYIHYRPAGGSWTTVPGVKMDDCAYSGYKVKTINIGSATQLEACFTDGQGNWDSNYLKNYFFNVGVWTYTQYGNIASGPPQ